MANLKFSTFRMHLTNQGILTKLLDYSQELREHYELYQLLLFHFQEKQTEHFFDLIHETLPKVNPIFQTVFRTFLKDKIITNLRYTREIGNPKMRDKIGLTLAFLNLKKLVRIREGRPFYVALNHSFRFFSKI